MNKSIIKIIKNIVLSLCVLATLLLIICWVTGCKIRNNQSNSLDMRLAFCSPYFVNLKKGDYVSIDKEIYPGIIVKQIMGTEGDVIEIKDRKIYIDGRYLGNIRDKSPIKDIALLPIEEGIIPKDYVYLGGDSAMSFDSRYKIFGLVHINEVKEKIWKIF
jgi:signal peptidase I